MTPFEVYKDYLALRNQFTSPYYDYFKYRGGGSANQDSFDNRKDKFFFEKVAKHRDPHNFMLANFVKFPKTWIRDIAYSDEAEKIYQDWLKRKENLTYLLQNDLNKLQFPFDRNFAIENGQLSHLLVLYLGGEINIETTCVLTDLVRCYRYWDKQLEENVIWLEIGQLIKKYTPFVKYDKDEVNKIVLDFFAEKA
jgi:T4 gene Gp59 loader of gp41 DNA helicase